MIFSCSYTLDEKLFMKKKKRKKSFHLLLLRASLTLLPSYNFYNFVLNRNSFVLFNFLHHYYPFHVVSLFLLFFTYFFLVRWFFITRYTEWFINGFVLNFIFNAVIVRLQHSQCVATKIDVVKWKYSKNSAGRNVHVSFGWLHMVMQWSSAKKRNSSIWLHNLLGVNVWTKKTPIGREQIEINLIGTPKTIFTSSNCSFNARALRIAINQNQFWMSRRSKEKCTLMIELGNCITLFFCKNIISTSNTYIGRAVMQFARHFFCVRSVNIFI